MGFLNSCYEPVKIRIIAVLGMAGLPPYLGDQGLEQGSRALQSWVLCAGAETGEPLNILSSRF